MFLATYNIESFGETRLNEDRLAPRISALRPKLEELEADILCLQEVNAQKPHGGGTRSFDALDRLVKGTRYQDYHRAFSRRPDETGPADRHSLMILSAYPVIASRSICEAYITPPNWMPVHADPPFKDPLRVSFDRPVLHAELDTGSAGILHVFCVHLRAPIAAAIPGGKNSDGGWKSVSSWAEGYYLAAMKRVGQALEIRLAIETIFDKSPDAMIAVAGDLNAAGVESALRILKADPQDTWNGALASHQLHQLNAAIPLEARHTVLHDGKGRVLDHILASPALAARARSVEIFNEDLADEYRDSGTDAELGSFHAALRAEIVL